MLLKKSNFPCAVSLPDGGMLSLANLPPRHTRWVASRKAIVVRAVRCGLLSRADALTRYELSEEELSSWEQALGRHGKAGLKIVGINRGKQP